MSEELRHIINMLHLVGYTEYGGQLTLTISECRLIFEYIKQLNDNIKGEQYINIDNLSKHPSSSINKLYEIKDYYFDLACQLLYEEIELNDRIMNCIKVIERLKTLYKERYGHNLIVQDLDKLIEILNRNNDFSMKKLIVFSSILIVLTGCNKQVFDKSYTFNKIVCNYDGDKFELDIKSWTDYDDGEQIQIKSKDGNTYLLSANKCYMIGD